MITYSVIIPHKNSPELLKRLVDSIPMRDDIQIIVVDDNSDDEKKPYGVDNRAKVILLTADQSNTAGHARNVGIEHANGKWLLFADADDYYCKDAFNVFDEYKNADIDMLLFNVEIRDSATHKLVGYSSRLNKMFEDCDGTKEKKEPLMYLIHTPWIRMVRSGYVSKFNMKFETVINGNDSMFAYQTAYNTSKIAIDKRKLYVYTTSPNTVTKRKHTKEQYLSNMMNISKNVALYDFLGHPEWKRKRNLCYFFYKLLKKKEYRDFLDCIMLYMRKHIAIKQQQNKYVELLSRRK